MCVHGRDILTQQQREESEQPAGTLSFLGIGKPEGLVRVQVPGMATPELRLAGGTNSRTTPSGASTLTLPDLQRQMDILSDVTLSR